MKILTLEDILKKFSCQTIMNIHIKTYSNDAPVDRALKYGCKKVQLVKEKFDQSMIDKAHANGIRCNVFWSDDPEEAKQFLNMVSTPS